MLKHPQFKQVLFSAVIFGAFVAGFLSDAPEKIGGGKRHIIDDTQGLPVGALLGTPDVHDRGGASDMRTGIHHSLPWLHQVFADAAIFLPHLWSFILGAGQMSTRYCPLSGQAR